MSMACCIRRTRRNSWPFFVRSASASTTGARHLTNGPVHLCHDHVHSSCLANCFSFNSPSATPSHAATRSRSNQVLTYSVSTISTAICSLIALVYLYQYIRASNELRSRTLCGARVLRRLLHIAHGHQTHISGKSSSETRAIVRLV